MQDEHMIETLTSHTTQEALTDGIGSRSRIRSFEHLDVTGLGNPIEGHPKLAIVITDEILRSHPIGCGFSKLLCRPRVGGDRVTPTWITFRECSSMMKKAKSEWKKRSVTGRRVARPDMLSMSLQKCAPSLSSWLGGADLPHILLNGPLAEADAQLEQFASDPLCSPQSVVPGHFLDQGHSFLGNPWCERSCPRLAHGMRNELSSSKEARRRPPTK